MASSSRTRLLCASAVLAVAGTLGVAPWAIAQETTGALQGTVTMKQDQSALPGVSVEAIHVPTGTRYSAVTSVGGRFSILNVRVGGPYTVSVNLSGFRTQTQKNIDVALGEKRNLAFEMELATVQESVVVTAEAAPLISPDRMGSGSAVAEAQIKVLPTIRRQFQDLARTNPYVNLTASDPTSQTITVAGKNNRYNTIQIDGAVNNDLFGLAATGTPGGQTDTQPINLDSIQELQVVVSPYDVKQGGFTGGAINAITKSGSNDLNISVYGSTRNQNWVGSKVPQANGDALERPIADFSSDQAGARLGGPILRDRLFFFVSGELNRLSQPTGGSADGSTTNVYKGVADAAQFRNIVMTKYGFDPGTLGDFNTKTDSNLLFGRFDINASPSNQVTLRHNYVDAVNDILTPSRGSNTFTFESTKYAISDKTNSTVLLVNSVFGASSFNSGRIGYQTIKDNRVVPVGVPALYVCITANTFCSGSGQANLIAGTERSSGANSLDQTILEITDDFTIIKGNHTITLGTHNEFFKFKNLFIQDATGTYFFNTLADLDKQIANRYQVIFSNGSDPRKPTEFGAQQWGLYIGDQWRVNNSLTLNLGIRADLPRITDKPSYNAKIESTFGINNTDVPNNQLMISPRLGFNWAPSASGKDQVRGGIGVFAGRTPFVWISNVFGGTGIETTRLTASNVPYVADPNNPPKNFPPGTSAVSVDTIDPDFKFPRVLRTTLGYDRELPGGIRASLEAGFTRTLQDIFYVDRNKVQSANPSFFGGPTYTTPANGFSNVTYLTNTDRGEQQTALLQLEKRFAFGLTLNGTYAYTNSKAAFEGTSSVAFSNWQFAVNDGNDFTEQLSRSFFEVRDRFNLVASQTFRTGPLNHSVGLFFSAQSGQPYSITMLGDPNRDGVSGNDLIFVPNRYSDVIFRAGAGGTVPTEADWEAFLSRTGLDEYRGRVAPRNSLTTPWFRSLDFHYDVEVPITVVKAQVTFDVLNLMNLLNSDWGLGRYVSNQSYGAVTWSTDAATGKPVYTVAANALNDGRQYTTQDLRSRWQLKLGLRLSY